MRLTYVGHGCVLLELDGLRVLVDPVLRRWAGPLLRHGALPAAGVYERVDVVLVTHLHIDHLDLPSLKLVGGDPDIVIPAHGVELLRRHGFRRVHGIAAGESYEAVHLTATATAARHDGRRRPGAEDGEAVGYVVRGSQAAYVAGDTGLFDGMAGLAGDLDLACLPVDGWGMTLPEDHLGPLTAAHALRLLRPRVAVPIHWGTYLLPSVALLRRPDARAAAFARYAAELAPGVDVRVLPPGASTKVTEKR